MKWIARILIVLVALAENIAWTYVVVALLKSLTAFAGAGDDPGGRPNAGDGLLGQLIVGAISLFILSPYLGMVIGSLNLIAGKALRIAYLYSVPVLSIMTFFLCLFSLKMLPALVNHSIRSIQPPWVYLPFMTLGNIVAGGFWAYYFKEDANSADSRIATMNL